MVRTSTNWSIRLGTIFLVLQSICSDAGQLLAPSDVRPILERALAADEFVRGGFAYSAVGNRLAMEKSGGIWLLRVGKDNPTRIASGSQPVFSPDGKKVAFWSDESGDRQLWIYALSQGKTRQLTHVEGGILSTPAFGYDLWGVTGELSWSPDSSVIAFTHIQRTLPDRSSPRAGPVWQYSSNEPAPWPYRDLFFPGSEYQSVRYDRQGERGNIFLVRAGDGELRQLTQTDDTFLAPSWSPDGTVIAALRRGGQHDIKPQVLAEPELVAISVKTGGVTPLSTRPRSMSVPRWSPDGKHIAFVAHAGTLGFSRLYILNPNTASELEVAGPQLGHAKNLISWVNNHEISLVVNFGLDDGVLHVDAKGGQLLSAFRVHARIDGIVRDRQRNADILLQDDPLSPFHIVSRAHGGASKTLYYSSTQLEPSERPQYRPLHWRNSQGEMVEGMLLLPRNIGHAEKPPVILNPYPGAASWRYNATAHYGVSLLLSRGYAVFWVNARAPHSPTTAYMTGSEEFGRAGIGAGGLARLVDDISSGIETLSAAGYVDTKRMCGFGHSNGGATLAQFITLSNSLRCAVIQTPAFAGGSHAYFRDVTFSQRIGAELNGMTPWTNAEEYAALDPLLRLQNVTASTLIIGGREDFTVFDTVELFNGLTSAGKAADLLVYGHEHHVFGLDALADMWVRVLNFFESSLKGAAQHSALSSAE